MVINVVSAKQFRKGIKKGQYAEAFVAYIQDENKNKNFGELNFTHRTAHGTQGQGDKTSLSKLASSTLKWLKKKFVNVFQEPTYPVERDQVFEH